jgi:hypothetical protein
MTKILESGMEFKCSSQTCFPIEQHEPFKTLKTKIKIADFLLLRKNNSVVWCVEAKSSSPQPGNKPRFNEFILEIKDKLLNTFSLYFAMRLKRHPEKNDWPDAFMVPDVSNVSVQFVLIIAGHKAEWLPPLKDALYSALYPTGQMWNLGPNPVIVFNDDMARKCGLIR